MFRTDRSRDDGHVDAGPWYDARDGWRWAVIEGGREMRPQPTRFLDALAASVMAAVPVDAFDPVALALAIGREEQVIAEIAHAAELTPAQTDNRHE